MPGKWLSSPGLLKEVTHTFQELVLVWPFSHNTAYININ